jgi:hypothetical protein
MSRAVPLLPNWVFMACYRVKGTFTFTITRRYCGFIIAKTYIVGDVKISKRPSVTIMFNSGLVVRLFVETMS